MNEKGDWNAFVESLDRDKYGEMYRAYTAKPKPSFEVAPIKVRKGKK